MHCLSMTHEMQYTYITLPIRMYNTQEQISSNFSVNNINRIGKNIQKHKLPYPRAIYP